MGSNFFSQLLRYKCQGVTGLPGGRRGEGGKAGEARGGMGPGEAPIGYRTAYQVAEACGSTWQQVLVGGSDL